MSIIGIDPISALVNGITALNNVHLGQVEEKALLEEVLEELKSNLKTIKDDYLKNNVPIEKIIIVFKINKLESAEKARKRKKLDFNQIKKGKIEKICFVSEYQFSKYADYDTEKVLLKLREKISDLKKAKQLYYAKNKWSNKINTQSRMNTIVNLFILLSNHLTLK